LPPESKDLLPLTVCHHDAAVAGEGPALSSRGRPFLSPAFCDRAGFGAIMTTSGCSQWTVMQVTDSRAQSSYKGGPEQSGRSFFKTPTFRKSGRRRGPRPRTRTGVMRESALCG